MADSPPAHTDIAAPTPLGNGKQTLARRKGARTTPPVTCGICGERYQRLASHVRQTHGLTPGTYARVFEHALSHTATHTHNNPQGNASGVPGETIRALALACAESPDFTDRLATDVGAHLLNGGMRSMLAASLAACLQTRMEIAGSAAAVLSRLNDELAQDWRIDAGGEMGAPTPTRDLLGMAQSAQHDLDKATDAVLRAGKLAIDERRGERGEALGDAPLDRYQGTRDALPLPDDVGPGERAIMLQLLERLAKGARAQRLIIDAAGATPVQQVESPPFD